MALLVLIVTGALLGWLASILARTESAGEILRQIGIGLIASLVAGLFVNSGAVLGGLSLLALAAGAGTAIVLLVGYHALLRRSDA
jgi:uncharacterized membrane protein YeaQ/YmgE (transglycosylase-associated protein family)